jgi:hypothetical protein
MKGPRHKISKENVKGNCKEQSTYLLSVFLNYHRNAIEIDYFASHNGSQSTKDLR